MIGCTPESAADSANSSAPNRLPVSVTATAGIPFFWQSLTSSFTLMAPSDRE